MSRLAEGEADCVCCDLYRRRHGLFKCLGGVGRGLIARASRLRGDNCSGPALDTQLPVSSSWPAERRKAQAEPPSDQSKWISSTTEQVATRPSVSRPASHLLLLLLLLLLLFPFIVPRILLRACGRPLCGNLFILSLNQRAEFKLKIY